MRWGTYAPLDRVLAAAREEICRLAPVALHLSNHYHPSIFERDYRAFMFLDYFVVCHIIPPLFAHRAVH
jgi:hypothetical protein